MEIVDKLKKLFIGDIQIEGNFIELLNEKSVIMENQQQTQDIFSDKWAEADDYENINKLYEFQYEWFLKLYGFESENDLSDYLKDKHTIIDTGCGLGYKAAWFAKLAPHAIVLGVDISDAAKIAAKNFHEYPNLFFFRGDIANTGIKANSIDFTVCDQVIMHTEVPESTFEHLSDITSIEGQFACYVYAKKALPRELVDDYFRSATHSIDKKEMWQMSSQLTELGKVLSDLNVKFVSPDIPALGIKGGEYDIQRFIYWNFLKCFWKEDWGFDLSKSTNFDWYAPSNAKRFSKSEFMKMIDDNRLEVTFIHEEEACYSGRFLKTINSKK
ncbi:MAG: SAM-dependent methyltransferase [Sphingobacteriales bacterium 17-39-43]|uniref:class I SAM-dependent methyltransferase n=1 Tax=Daejeonella sp. TaxID=2805397 RepID=UPI000BC68D51|nr:class I SAM-dependent methyltransferase [Daejeonella sp.]OYZ30185.1 MAG: SAM-dependent methyltransferase [Sphingobacteriales bacterium 16-39-50]OZA22928.1 MAG: SAM-dependent methyltransferase [Sphingobacteriales bacterium 17-39-43]HQT24179.1 class I SAM-dependent methyltransferase [Daejeonella sp.]HQT58789.1 class I SAM-dependent methyltransferase [Daejeonella sp.]